MLRGIVRKYNIVAIRKSENVRVTSIYGSSEGTIPKSLFITIENCTDSNRHFVSATIETNTYTIIYRSVRVTERRVRKLKSMALIRIRSSECTLTVVTTGFCSGPSKGLALINVAKAGKGAAAIALLREVFATLKCGYKLLSAVTGCINSENARTIGAASSPLAVGSLVTRVISTKYRCYFVRIDSVKIRRREIRKLGFGIKVFSGLARSRLSCRGAFTRCLHYGGLFFSELPTSTCTVAGVSSHGNVIVVRGAETGLIACSYRGVTSRAYEVVRRKFRKVLLEVSGCRT